ncbi:hypothetical protein [Tenacibaculum jejuense]|nr:hypothetical protein [Tenacibaculum jejuense]
MKNIDSLKLSLKNVPLDIKPSEDNQIHFDFKLEFENFSDKERISFLESIKFNEEIIDEVINFDVKSEIELNRTHAFYERVTDDELSKLVNGVIKNYMVFSLKRKSKKEILKKYRKGKGEDYEKFIRLKEKVIVNNDKKLIKTFFTIRIPKQLNTTIDLKAKQCNLDFNELEFKNLNVFVDGGYLKIRKINKSKLTCWNGSVFLGEVDSSIITARSTTNILIGGIANSNIIGEHTKVEIGEVGEYNDIKDFGSRFYLYDFTDSFKKMNFKGEYSKIYFYEPDNDYKLRAYGNTSVFKYGEIEAKVEPNKEQKKTHMFGVKRKYKKPYAGELYFDIENTEFNLKEFEKKSK